MNTKHVCESVTSLLDVLAPDDETIVTCSSEEARSRLSDLARDLRVLIAHASTEIVSGDHNQEMSVRDLLSKLVWENDHLRSSVTMFQKDSWDKLQEIRTLKSEIEEHRTRYNRLAARLGEP